MLDDGDPFHCWEDPVVAFHVGPEIDGPVAAAIDGGTGSTALAMAGRAVLLVPDSSGGGVCLLELVLCDITREGTPATIRAIVRLNPHAPTLVIPLRDPASC